MLTLDQAGAVLGLVRPGAAVTEPGTELIGSAFTVMTRLAGRPLSEVIGSFAADEVRAVYRQIGAALSAVHRVPQDAYGYLTTHVPEPVPDNTAYMTRQFAGKLQEFAERGGDPALHDRSGRSPCCPVSPMTSGP